MVRLGTCGLGEMPAGSSGAGPSPRLLLGRGGQRWAEEEPGSLKGLSSPRFPPSTGTFPALLHHCTLPSTFSSRANRNYYLE